MQRFTVGMVDFPWNRSDQEPPASLSIDSGTRSRPWMVTSPRILNILYESRSKKATLGIISLAPYRRMLDHRTCPMRPAYPTRWLIKVSGFTRGRLQRTPRPRGRTSPRPGAQCAIFDLLKGRGWEFYFSWRAIIMLGIPPRKWTQKMS